MAFLAELQRRNVIRVAGLYLVGAWLLVQVASTLLPIFNAPAWLPRAVVVLLTIGLLPTLIFSWVFELTAEGLKREREIDRTQSITHKTAQRIEHLIVVGLTLALGYLAFDKFVLAPRQVAALHQATARQVAEARRQGGAEALVRAYGDRSIAVLPFVNMSADKEQEYFSDGISEELLNQLAQIRELRVIARTSSFSFKGKDVDVATIARALNVAHLLEGSIRRSGDKVRISAKLIRTADSSELWSQAYDRDLSDIFSVQDEIAAAVVAQLKLKLLGATPTAKVVDPQAYALYVQARQLGLQRSAGAYVQALAMIHQALALDPDYAAAWAQLGLIYTNQADNGLRSTAEGYRLAREAANKALALDPNLASAHALLGWIETSTGNSFAAAAQHVARSLALAPDDGEALRNAAFLAQSLGRFDTATALAEAAVARDPANSSAQAALAYTYVSVGRLDDAIASYRTVLRLSPGYISAHAALSAVLLAKGQAQAALAEAQREPDGPWRLIALSMAWHALGRKAESDAALADLIRKYEKDGPYNIAYLYADRGEADRAFDWLDKAAASRDPGLMGIVAEPLFEKLRKDPRWLPYLRKLGRAPEQLAAIEFDVRFQTAKGL